MKKFILLVLTFCCLNFLICAEDINKSNEMIALYQNALNSYMTEDYENSISCYYKILALDPSQVPAKNQIRFVQNKIDSLNNLKAESIFEDVKLLLKDGNITLAKEKMIEASKINPNNKNILEIKELILQISGKDINVENEKNKKIINNIILIIKNEEKTAVDLALYLKGKYNNDSIINNLNKIVQRRFSQEYDMINKKLLENKCSLIEYRDMYSSNCMRSRKYVDCIEECDRILNIDSGNGDAYERKTWAYIWLFLNTPDSEVKLSAFNLNNVKINLKKAVEIKSFDNVLKSYLSRFEALNWDTSKIKLELAQEVAQQ